MAKATKSDFENNNRNVEKIEVKQSGIKFKLSKKHALIIVVIILIVLIPSGYFYNQYQSAKNLLKNPKVQTSVEIRALVDAVGKLIELPANEQPRLATVTDVTQLSGQPFFVKAKNGDKVLIYAQAGKAILYRESINKIIEVASVNVNTNSQVQVSITPTQVPQAQVATITILNGTLTTGLAKAAASKIKSNLPNIDVLVTGDVSNANNYQNTVVVDVTGNKQDATTQVAKLLGGKVETSIPAGETKPTSDILVILGSDYTK